MKKRWTVIFGGALVLAALVAIPADTSADRGGRTFKADLIGFNEVPAVSTTGTGEVELRLDNGGTALDYTLSYENLEGTETAASHIHLGQEAVNGGVIAFLCGGGGKPECPDVSGTVTGSIVAADVIGPAGQGIAAGEFDELLTALSQGVVYANVHTDKHPGGEIRGQLK
jgi:hypothetical protein